MPFYLISLIFFLANSLKCYSCYSAKDCQKPSRLECNTDAANKTRDYLNALYTGVPGTNFTSQSFLCMRDWLKTCKLTRCPQVITYCYKYIFYLSHQPPTNSYTRVAYIVITKVAVTQWIHITLNVTNVSVLSVTRMAVIQPHVLTVVYWQW